MPNREEGAAAPNWRQGQNPATRTTTKSRCSRTATYAYKLVKF